MSVTHFDTWEPHGETTDTEQLQKTRFMCQVRGLVAVVIHSVPLNYLSYYRINLSIYLNLVVLKLKGYQWESNSPLSISQSRSNSARSVVPRYKSHAREIIFVSRTCWCNPNL